MEYLLVMALSGSTMTLLYLAVHRILKEKISARAYYLLAKAAVIYYLIPLPYLKVWYRDVLHAFWPKGRRMATQLPLTWTSYAVRAEGRSYANIFAVIQWTAVIIWLAGAGFVIAKRLTEYVRTARRFARYAEREMTDRHREVITDLKARFGVKRRITLHFSEDGGPTMTFGMLHPVILCSKEPGSPEAELLLRHEMVHIRRLDVLWKMLLQFASFIHWWNPILWRLDRSFDRDCECSCDEAAVSGKAEEEIRAYLRLLVEEATEKKETKKAVPRWKAGFGDNAQKIKERVDNLMMGKKWNRLAAGTLVAVLTFANSMTVFAYRNPVQVKVEETAPQEEITRTLGVSAVEFVADEVIEEKAATFEVIDKIVELNETELLYDKQFTDETGNVYPVDDAGIEPQHSHDLVWGTYAEHTKYSNGGCEVREYRAQMCTNCNYIIRHELRAIYNYVTCPH